MLDELTAAIYSDDSEMNTHIKNDKENFYESMKEFGFDFNDIDEDTKLPKALLSAVAGELPSIIRLNNALLSLHRSKKTNIVDAYDYLLDDYLDDGDLMKITQTPVLGVLQAELAAKHNLFGAKQTKKSKFIH